jgi:uncharacterized surface protein with fasciclin (FAS1) repeats
MVSMQGYCPSLDYRFMYDVRDIRASPKLPTTNTGSIMDIIQNNPDFSIFNHLVNLADMNGIFNTQPAKFTVFVPSDSHLQKCFDINTFLNMDKYTARQIILYSTLPKIADLSTLQLSPILELETRLTLQTPGFKIVVQTPPNQETLINNNVRILQPNLPCINGLIHIVDFPLIPENLV